jgi:hypothetical protein
MGQRSRYWSCTKFANLLRGTPKPRAATSKEWRRWRSQAKSKHPIRFWLAEEALDAVQNFIWAPVDKLYSIKYYVNNRWVTRTHALTAHPNNIRPGRWRDLGNRFLPCMFNELVDFVEIELAWANIAWDEEARKKYKAPGWSWGWFRWRTWRCPEAGLEHLHWQMSLRNDEEWVDNSDPDYGKPTTQAVSAGEILELYNWWKNVYPNRGDPLELSGWSAFCVRRREKVKAQDPNDDDELGFFDMEEDEETRSESHRILDLSYEIERKHNEEDTEMMCRLIKIRDRLWT